MEADTGLITGRRVEQVVMREDLLTLATLCDQHATAVSFGFGHVTTPDNAHHKEVIAVKGLVQEAIANFAPEPAPVALSKDLEQVLAVVEEIRLNPARLRLVFACRDQGFWREFDLPSTGPLSFLHLGRRFHLAPIMLALQSIAPYCVAILESRKARAFVVRGTAIQEVTGRLAIEELSSPVNDPRVGWSRHVIKGRTEHERGYFKNLSHQLLQLVSEQKATGLVIGCHEDLWGEVEPQFVHLEKVLIGRFHLPHFDAESTQVLRMTMPIFTEAQKTRVAAVLREINETPSRGALGVKDVLEALLAGRVQKLVVGRLPGQTISDCKACGRMMAVAGRNCVSCGKAEICNMAAEEGLIRQALLTDAEILFVEGEAEPGFNGAAALLRY
jgi:Bacterial archaeo-eukaryotic release factor family 10